MPQSRPARSRLLLGLFVLSGVSGLCFEILWARQLQVVLGATTQAVTAVVTLLMAGLALGGAAGGRLATRVRRPALAYGIVELGIGVSALAVTWALPLLERLGSIPARYALSTLLLLVPSAGMGLTWPLVTQASDPQGRSGGGFFYAANTFGAMAGCILAGFLGIGMLGVQGTAAVVACLNLLCGALAWRFLGGAVPSDAAGASPCATRGDWQGPAPTAILAVAALCGCAGLGAEILWTRALLPYVNSSSYAFSAILATYLCGLALGAAWVTRTQLQRTTHNLLWLLGILQLLLVVASAAAPRVLSHVDALLPLYVGVRQVTTVAAWLATVVGVFAKTAVVVLPPTCLMGASLPLCVALAGRRGMAGGQAAGWVSAVNTAGGIFGSLVAGFLLLPRLGATTAMLVMAGCNLVAAALVLRAAAAGAQPAAAPSARLRAVAAVCVALGTAALVGPRALGPFLGRLANGTTALLVDEGPQDTTAVISRPGKWGPERVILSNGVSYASDALPSERYMALLGHLPALLTDDPAQALVICVGTGTTAAAIALHPAVQHLDLVDISPVVHKTLPLFTKVNRSVWLDPRVEIHQADGRQFMTATDRRYGIVALEPPPPRIAGAASLYTVDIYRRARASMTPGGVIAQWLPLHGMTEEETLMLARSFQEVFPHAALALLTPDEAALIGSAVPLRLDMAQLAQRTQQAGVRDALVHLGLGGPADDQLQADLVALLVSSDRQLAGLVGPGPVVTDDRPLIEQFAVLLASDQRARLDPDGRLGLLRRVMQAPRQDLPLVGGQPPALAQARAAMTQQVAAWVRDAPMRR